MNKKFFMNKLIFKGVILGIFKIPAVFPHRMGPTKIVFLARKDSRESNPKPLETRAVIQTSDVR